MQHMQRFAIVINLLLLTGAQCMPLVGQLNCDQSQHREPGAIASVESGKKPRWYMNLVAEEQLSVTLHRRDRVTDQRRIHKKEPAAKLKPRGKRIADPSDIPFDEIKDLLQPDSNAPPKSPGPDELAPYLSPKDEAEFQAARDDLRHYKVALEAVRRAEEDGLEPTAKQREALKWCRKRVSLYLKLRRRAIKAYIASGDAAPEIIAYYKRLLENSVEVRRAWVEEMSQEERKEYFERREAQERERRTANKARMEELEERARNNQATEGELSELAGLQAGLERKRGPQELVTILVGRGTEGPKGSSIRATIEKAGGSEGQEERA